MRNLISPTSTILASPLKNASSEWRTDLSLGKRAKLMKAAQNIAKQYYLNRSHEENGLLTEGATITLRSRKFTYSWLVKGFTPANSFEIARADDPRWALSFRVNENGFCLDSDPNTSEYPLMILEHADSSFRNELSAFNKEISDPYSLIFGVAGWDHRQLMWYWQTKPPREFAYRLISSEKLNQLLEMEETILFTIDRFSAGEDLFRVSLYGPFSVKTIEISLTNDTVRDIAHINYPEGNSEFDLGNTGS